MTALIWVSVLVTISPALAREKLCLNDLPSRVFPDSALGQWDTLQVDADNQCHPRHPDKKMIYACRFSNLTVKDRDCGHLPGRVSFDTRSGILSWTPGDTAFGAYQFEMIASHKTLTASEIFWVDIHAPYPMSGLVADFDADFARGDRPPDASDRSWLATNSRDISGYLTGGVWSLLPPLPWLHLGSNAGVDFGTRWVASDVTIHAWMALSLAQQGTHIWSQGDFGAWAHRRGDRYHLRLSGDVSYAERVKAERPSAFWRMQPSEIGVGDQSENAYPLRGGAGLEFQNSDAAGDSFARFTSASEPLEGSQVSLMPGAVPWTVEAWIRLDPERGGTILNGLACGDGVCARALFDVLPSGFVRLYLRDRAGRSLSIASATPVTDGKWHHVVGTYDRINAVLYLDGHEGARGKAALGTISAEQNLLTVGAREGGEAPLIGDIDELALYPAALDSETVSAHHDRYFGCVSSDPLSTTGWHLVSIAPSGSRSHVFIDGKFQCDVATAVASGNWQWGGLANGALANLRLYRASDLGSIAEYHGLTVPRFAAIPWDGGPVPILPKTDPVLTIVKTGEGVVHSSPLVVDCGNRCSASVAPGTSVVLTATPDTNWRFVGWTGADCFGETTCTVTMDSDRTVDAVFERALVNVSVAVVGTGRVVSMPAGLDCNSQCEATYASSSLVELSAIAAEGSRFAGWIGGSCGTAATCQVTANESLHVVALFEYRLRVVKTGSGIVTASTGELSCIGDECVGYYAPGTSVTLSATPLGDSIFGGWGCGWCSGTGDCTIMVDAPILVFANLLDSHYRLTVTKYGNGIVRSQPQAIDCGGTCNADVARGTVVTLTAEPGPDETFGGWGGGWCSGLLTCTVTMNQATPVTAIFSLPLTVRVIGTGTVTSTPEGMICSQESCTKNFAYGSAITLQATPGPKSIFEKWWSGYCGGNGTCRFTMTAPVTVYAFFLEPTYEIQIATFGEGTVRSSPSGIECGSDCSQIFDRGTQITLTAIPAPGYRFSHWYGGYCSGTGSCTVTMNQFSKEYAYFVPE